MLCRAKVPTSKNLFGKIDWNWVKFRAKSGQVIRFGQIWLDWSKSKSCIPKSIRSPTANGYASRLPSFYDKVSDVDHKTRVDRPWIHYLKYKRRLVCESKLSNILLSRKASVTLYLENLQPLFRSLSNLLLVRSHQAEYCRKAFCLIQGRNNVRREISATLPTC